jgi:hypothetical protein
MKQEHERRLREIIEFHNRFAKAFKLIENFVGAMDSTSLNDIRYALRGLVDCLNAALDENDEIFNEHCSTTMTALRIAWHDVVDITVQEFRVYLDELCKRYGSDLVAKHVSYKAARSVIHKAQEKSMESRGDRNRRVQLYQEICDVDLVTLLDCYQESVSMEPAIITEWKRERRKTRVSNAALFLSAIAVCVALYVNFLKPSTIPVAEAGFQPSDPAPPAQGDAQTPDPQLAPRSAAQ